VDHLVRKSRFMLQSQNVANLTYAQALQKYRQRKKLTNKLPTLFARRRSFQSEAVSTLQQLSIHRASIKTSSS